MSDLHLPFDVILPETERGMGPMIQAFAEITATPAFCRGEGGETIWQSSHPPCLCSLFGEIGAVQETCPPMLSAAGSAATNLQEPYVFMCPAGLILFACPRDERGCTWFIGPLAMDSRREDAIAKILSRFSEDPRRTAAVGAFLSDIRVWTPEETSSLYKILSRCAAPPQLFRPFPLDGDSFSEEDGVPNRLMPYTSISYPEEPEKELLGAVLSGDMASAANAFRLYYEKTYLQAAGNFEKVRMNILELFNYLSGKLGTSMAASFFIENLENLSQSDSFNAVYNLSEAMIRRLTDTRFHSYAPGTPPLIRQVLHLIREQFDQDLTLSAAAEAVHVSPSYLSMVFRRETGQTFIRFLTGVRLENACRALRETDQSVTEISTRNGFSSQSYFIRIFRKNFGMTPLQYRKKFETLTRVPQR